MPSCAVEPSPRTSTRRVVIAVAHGDVAQPPVAGLARGVENDPDVHHDVDEQRILGDERAQVLALFLEPQGQRLAGLHQHIVECAGSLVSAYQR